MTREGEDSGSALSSVALQLRKSRTVKLGTVLDDAAANRICAELLFLQSEDATQGVALHIDSPGGSVTAGLAIADTMEFIGPPVSTVCVGQAAGMAAVLLAAGAKGKRFALRTASVTLRSPSGVDELDAATHPHEVARLLGAVTELLVSHTGRPSHDLERDRDEGRSMTPEEARAYGLIDEVLTTPSR